MLLLYKKHRRIFYKEIVLEYKMYSFTFSTRFILRCKIAHFFEEENQEKITFR